MLITKIQNGIARLLLLIIVSTMLAPSMLVRADELATTTDLIAPLTSAEEGSSTNKTINPDIQSNPTSDQSTYYIDRYYEKSPSGGKNYYFLGDIPLGVDDLQTNTLEYTLPDHLQSKSVVTDNQGVLKKVSDYYPYGKTSTSQGIDPIDNNHQFTNKVFDPENSLQYFGARYYDNITGRFMAIDPLTLELTGDKFKDKEKLWVLLSDPQRLNSYSYANNNPVVNYDPDGRSSLIAWVLRPVETAVQVGLWHTGAQTYLRQNNLRASADFLDRSLSLEPSSLNIDESNSRYGYVIDEIKESPEYKKFISNYIEYANTQKSNEINLRPKELGNSIELVEGDLFTSFGKVAVNYLHGVRQSDGSWDFSITLADVYNFEPKNYKGNALAKVANNLAVPSQASGVISNYDIQVNFNDKNHHN